MIICYVVASSKIDKTREGTGVFFECVDIW